MSPFGIVSVMLAVVAALSLAAVAGEAPREGGLEAQASAGEWIARGFRGGGLRVSGPAQRALDLPAACARESGSLHFMLRVDEDKGEPGVILGAGGFALEREADPGWLRFRVGSRAVRKPVYDWIPPDSAEKDPKSRQRDGWRHVILSWNKGEPALYLDGRPGDAPVDAAGGAEAFDGLYLGGAPGAASFDELTALETPTGIDDALRLSRNAHAGAVVPSTPILAVPRLSKAPTLDGKLEPGEWDGAAGFGGFQPHNSSHHPEANRLTRAWFGYDDARFYLAVKIPVVRKLAHETTERDKLPFHLPTVELFLMPNPSGELEYYQLAFNNTGSFFDGRIADTESYNPEWTLATQADEEWWTAEAAIPLAAINALKPADGARWKMNLVCHSGQWSPSGSYHDATRFGVAKLVESRPALFVDAPSFEGGKLRVPFKRTGGGEGSLTVKARYYPAKSSAAAAAADVVATAALPGGTLELDVGANPDGLLEVVAFEDAQDPLFARFLPLNAKYFGPAVFWKDLPPEAKEPPKPQEPETQTAEARQEAEARDYRPSKEALEKQLIKQQEWLNNPIGKTPLLPKPWTPMEVDGEKVACWAKGYDFSGGYGLPRQVEILGAPVFDAPVELVSGTEGGKPTVFVKEQAEDHVTLIGTRRFGDVVATLETRLEFDGFAKHELTLSPVRAGAALEGLTLRLPFRSERAKYYHWWYGAEYGRPAWEVGNALEKDLASGFESQVWLGDDERGFCWFAEAPENWSHPDAKDIVRIARRGERTDLELDFLRGRQALEKPVRFVFGTMATPAKPRREGWRTWEGKFQQDWAYFTAFSSFYPPKNPEAFRRNVKNPFVCTMLSCYFYGTCFVEDGKPTPEMWLWLPLWTTRGDKVRPPIGPHAGQDGKHISYAAVTAAGTWPDFYMHGLKGYREEFGIRSLYLDTCIREVMNPLVGMSWTDASGKARPKTDIFAFREMARRIRNFIHEDPEAVVMMHHSNQVAIPILSFMDIHMNGEHFNTGPHQVQGRNYVDVMPPGTMRSCYMLHQWGVVPSFLPEHPESTRSLLGYFWVHDAAVYGAWCDYAVLRKAERAKQSFGMGDVEFLGYWTPQAPAREPANADRERVFVSAYRKLDGSEVMLLVANMTEDDRHVRVVLDEKNLGLPLAGRTLHAQDLEFGRQFKVEDGRFEVPVLRQDFRMIVLKRP
ncbi:MAG: DUF6067 family protein [Planctomycetota bacterium]|nr:DUF6067 family protein [Planctomycetota bacterium]